MAWTKASGKEHIDLTSQVVEHIAKQFNNPDISDVTLMVGEEVYSAHRFVLASQSSVFCAMLLGENWKESVEKTVPLEEQANVVTFFPDFLKFFYTGKLTLTIDNVCIIHTLADKYMVSALKDGCLGFMKDVLTGVHGDALEAGVKWLEYIENFVQDLVAACYSAIRNNMILVNVKERVKGKLNKEQIIRIFTVDKVEDDIVTVTEARLFKSIRHLYSGNEIDSDFMPLFRFYNMSSEELQMYNCQEGKQVLEAYIVKAEIGDIACRANKKRRLSDGSATDEIRCRCPINTKCPHINPRFYLETPFSGVFGGNLNKTLPHKVDPIDLRDVKTFAKKMMSVAENHNSSLWSVRMKSCYSGEPIYESYEVTPAHSHLGRMYTVAIVLSAKNPKHAKYTIKHTGRVESEEMSSSVKSVVLKSPLCVKDSRKPTDQLILGVSVLLHM